MSDNVEMGLLASDNGQWNLLGSLRTLPRRDVRQPKKQFRGRESRVLGLLGIEQRRNNLIATVFRKQPAVAITQLSVFLNSLYYMFSFCLDYWLKCCHQRLHLTNLWVSLRPDRYIDKLCLSSTVLLTSLQATLASLQ